MKAIVPVYVLFTQVDLIPGFVDIFADLADAGRSEPWGATLKLDEGDAPPGERFRRELEVLIQRLHTRALRRMAHARDDAISEKVFGFPLELGAISVLTDFIAAAFSPAAGLSPPVFRGFYFTSGVQEGRPRARVIDATGQVNTDNSRP